MKGLVRIIRNGKVWEESSNMVLDGMGSVLADAMTASPSLSAISTASAILDTSNYTIQAISFGKDAKGYYNHAHNPTAGSILLTAADDIVRLKVNTFNSSSYITSDAHTYTRSVEGPGNFNVSANDPYKLLPEASNPTQTRLEQVYYGYPIDTSDEIGHNANKFDVSGELDNRWFRGCYPDASGSKYYLLSSWDSLNTPVGGRADHSNSDGASGIAYSTFNLFSSMDRDGFVKLAVSGAHEARQIAAAAPTYYGSVSGLVVYGADDFSGGGLVQLKVTYISTVSGGDLLFAGLFGGIYTLGLWAVDIKESINNGATLPFTFNHLDNKIKYKLVARKTFTRDLTYIHDYLSYSGYKFLENKNSEHGTPLTDNNHLIIQWEIEF